MENKGSNSEKYPFIPYSSKLKDRSRALRRNLTPAEKKLWTNLLRDHRLSFVRQKPLLRYIADFYCSKARLVIEVDGKEHSTESGKACDAERTSVLEAIGLNVVRFKNEDILFHFEDVKKSIEDELRKYK
jgi:very-short-patch-repair endonuclease